MARLARYQGRGRRGAASMVRQGSWPAVDDTNSDDGPGQVTWNGTVPRTAGGRLRLRALGRSLFFFFSLLLRGEPSWLSSNRELDASNLAWRNARMGPPGQPRGPRGQRRCRGDPRARSKAGPLTCCIPQQPGVQMYMVSSRSGANGVDLCVSRFHRTRFSGN